MGTGTWGIAAVIPKYLSLRLLHPLQLLMCFDAKETLQARNTHSSQTTQQSSTLSDAEKAKMLQEVEAQQADFGLQK